MCTTVAVRLGTFFLLRLHFRGDIWEAPFFVKSGTNGFLPLKKLNKKYNIFKKWYTNLSPDFSFHLLQVSQHNMRWPYSGLSISDPMAPGLNFYNRFSSFALNNFSCNFHQNSSNCLCFFRRKKYPIFNIEYIFYIENRIFLMYIQSSWL